MKVLLVRNSDHVPPGAFGDWLARQGHALTETTGEALDQAALDATDVLVLLGSSHGVYDRHIPWIPRQQALVAARLAARQPTIGICFGAQMIAAAAGGASTRHPEGHFFRGWHGIARADDPVLAGPWPRWHGDVITAPPGAEVLAEDAGTVQAIALPRAIGVQFHPEATPEILRDWGRRSLEKNPGCLDPAALDAESAALYPARGAARDALFGWMLRRATA
jgi:GMP synthase-like glutamine amidotransferase